MNQEKFQSYDHQPICTAWDEELVKNIMEKQWIGMI